MKEYLKSVHLDHTDDSLQNHARKILQTWQVAAREWSSLYCSLETTSGAVKAKRMKQLQALENKINYIADQYELARQTVCRMTGGMSQYFIHNQQSFRNFALSVIYCFAMISIYLLWSSSDRVNIKIEHVFM